MIFLQVHRSDELEVKQVADENTARLTAMKIASHGTDVSIHWPNGQVSKFTGVKADESGESRRSLRQY